MSVETVREWKFYRVRGDKLIGLNRNAEDIFRWHMEYKNTLRGALEAVRHDHEALPCLLAGIALVVADMERHEFSIHKLRSVSWEIAEGEVPELGPDEQPKAQEEEAGNVGEVAE